VGSGFNLVGLSEVEIPGVHVQKVARLPVAGVDRLRSLPAAARARLAQTPVDVVLQRQRGTRPEWDEERTLLRDFSLPQPRPSRLYGLARLAGDDARAPAADGCLTVATLDGHAVRVRLLDSQVSVSKSVLFESCGDVDLSAGAHRLRAVDGWALDTLV